MIGDYEEPKVRLPGAGGAPEIATSVREVFVMLRQTPRTFVQELDFRTSARRRGLDVVVTDLGVLEPRGADRELTLTAVHPGVEPDAAREATGWDLRVANDLERDCRRRRARSSTALRALATHPGRPVERTSDSGRTSTSGVPLDG